MQLGDSRGFTRGFTPRKAAIALTMVLCALAVVALITPVVTAGSRTPATKVVIAVDGQEYEWVSCEPTVGATLNQAGVTLNPLDRVLPAADANLRPGMRIKVTRIEDKVIYTRKSVPFPTVIRFNPQITGRRIVQEGRPGEKEVQCVYRYRDGVKVAEKVIGSNITKQPVTRIVNVSHPSMLASRDGMYVRHLRMRASAYSPFHCGGSANGHCAMGFPATKGIVAVDPRVIPLGTKLYVEGYGEALAADTGGAIKGDRIDLCFDRESMASDYGRRTVTVWILE